MNPSKHSETKGEKKRSDNVIWEWKDKNYWIAYDLATCQILEKAYCSDQLKLILDHGVFAAGPYHVDFLDMKQFNSRTSFERKIRRFAGEATRSDAQWTCRLKKKWEPYDKETCMELEKAFHSGQKSLQRKGYIIDFVEMKQINATTGFDREIRRQVDAKITLDEKTTPQPSKNRALPRITGVTAIAPEKCVPCYGNVMISIISATDIHAAFTGSDPYVVITTDFSSFAWSSPWKFKTTTPVWNETCALPVLRPNAEGKVNFTLYDHNIVKKPLYLGRLEIPLYEIVTALHPGLQGPRELTYECRGKNPGAPKGKLNLNIQWSPKPPPQTTKINYFSIVGNPQVTFHKTLAQSASGSIPGYHTGLHMKQVAITPEKVVEFADPNVVEGKGAHYEIMDLLGEGGYAVVKKAVNLATKENVAIKIMKTAVAEDALQKMTREIEILHVVENQFCVSAIESCLTKDAIYIIMEFLSGGDLLDSIIKVGSYQEDDTKKIIADVSRGLAYLHQSGICHRDLKPENILFHEGQNRWKIADFGCATFFEPSDPYMSGFEGTIQYMAPELFTNSRYTQAVDIWALGVVTYVAMSGYFPWQGQTEPEIQEAICSSCNTIVFYSPEFDEVSESGMEFIRDLMEFEPGKRICSKELLKHKWFIN